MLSLLSHQNRSNSQAIRLRRVRPAQDLLQAGLGWRRPLGDFCWALGESKSGRSSFEMNLAIFTLGLLELFIGFLIGVCQCWASQGVDGPRAAEMEVRVQLLLLPFPVPLIDLGEGHADFISKLLDEIVGPVGILLVTDLKHRLLVFIKPDARLLNLGLSSLFRHRVLTDCYRFREKVLLTKRKEFHIFVSVTEKSIWAATLRQLINQLVR